MCTCETLGTSHEKNWNPFYLQPRQRALLLLQPICDLQPSHMYKWDERACSKKGISGLFFLSNAHFQGGHSWGYNSPFGIMMTTTITKHASFCYKQVCSEQLSSRFSKQDYTVSAFLRDHRNVSSFVLCAGEQSKLSLRSSTEFYLPWPPGAHAALAEDPDIRILQSECCLSAQANHSSDNRHCKKEAQGWLCLGTSAARATVTSPRTSWSALSHRMFSTNFHQPGNAKGW